MWHKDDAGMDTKVTERTWSQSGPGHRADLVTERTWSQSGSGCKTDLKAVGSNEFSKLKNKRKG